MEEETEGDKNVQGTLVAQVRIEVPTYTLHTQPLPSTFVATIGGGTFGVTSAPSIATREIEVNNTGAILRRTCARSPDMAQAGGTMDDPLELSTGEVYGDGGQPG